ncbi:MAG: uroporphyrinogen decarboxylase family protein [Candidatus Bathyarchaeia archaeon]
MASSRERIVATLDLEEPDRVPITELSIFPTIIEAVTGQSATVESTVLCYEKLGMDMIPAAEKSNPLAYKTSEKGTWVDEWGIMWKNGAGMSQYIGGALKTPEDVKNFLPPDPDLPERIETVEETVKRVKGKMAVIGMLPGEKMGYLARGFVGFTVDMYRNPALAERLLDITAEYNVKLGRRMADCGVDALAITGDIADRDGPLFSPSLVRRFFIPCLKRMVRGLNKRNVPIVKHSDGNLNLILDDLVNTGIDALHSLEPIAGMEIKKVKEKYGHRICLIGNIDCSYTLCLKTPSETAQEVKECIRDASPGGGHILSSSNAFHSAVKIENIVAMIKASRDYGKYPIRAR